MLQERNKTTHILDLQDTTAAWSKRQSLSTLMALPTMSKGIKHTTAEQRKGIAQQSTDAATYVAQTQEPAYIANSRVGLHEIPSQG